MMEAEIEELLLAVSGKERQGAPNHQKLARGKVDCPLQASEGGACF